MPDNGDDALNISWLAGFFDGEGCISLTFQQRMWRLHVVITQKQAHILELVVDKFPEFGFKMRTNSRRISSLVLQGSNAKPFLEAIENKLVLKRKQAQLALFFLSVATGHGNRISDKGHETRAVAAEFMRREKESSTIQ